MELECLKKELIENQKVRGFWMALKAEEQFTKDICDRTTHVKAIKSASPRGW